MSKFPDKKIIKGLFQNKETSDRKYLEIVNVNQARSIFINHDDDMQSIKLLQLL